MGVERIHACPNHCILYRGDAFQELDKCLVCGASQYKSNARYFSGDEHVQTYANKGKRNGGRKGISYNEHAYTSLGIDDEKHRKISTLVMWYLPVVDCPNPLARRSMEAG